VQYPPVLAEQARETLTLPTPGSYPASSRSRPLPFFDVSKSSSKITNLPPEQKISLPNTKNNTV
jgi:hypothetical protein